MIITVCVLLIIAYIFDVSSSKTRIPSVILLLTVGWILRVGVDAFQISVPNLSGILPVLGIIGLVLIVLEGSLELELNKSKIPFVATTAIVAFMPMIIFSVLFAYLFHYFGNYDLKICIANAIPLGIISSAIAIPSVQNLIQRDKEFIVYESSLSDIFGVVFFNFITLNDTIGIQSIKHFLFQIIVILFISFFATLILAFLLSKIKHHVKFLPIIIMIVLIYSISKLYHLPALVFIMLFGLFLGNLNQLKSNKYIQKLQPDILIGEVNKFSELTAEIAFLIRALFFILFGFLIKTEELLNTGTVVWALAIIICIFLLRVVFLYVFKQKIQPIVYIAPRGLITILLFLSIPINQTISIVNKSLIIQVIILSALIMMLGLMLLPSKKGSIDAK